MEFTKFSPKQRKVLTWWCEESPVSGRDALICDGAIRSGKTLCMFLSFVSWATAKFSGHSFAICGKTITSLRRNVITPMVPFLMRLGFSVEEKISANCIIVSRNERSNRFYLFGGKDESSAALIQGLTLAGVLFDEVVLMPRSFVEQALARCSVEGSRFWFNCNPEYPQHWFYREWIQKIVEKNALYYHFTMKDNPSLSKKIRSRYEGLYSGVFYDRFVLGKWTEATGLIYPGASAKAKAADVPDGCEKYVISGDYGTVNPTSLGLWGRKDGRWYRIREYYYDSRNKGSARTDEEHYVALEQLAQNVKIHAVVIDPSAASFMEVIRRHGKYRVLPAKNQVLDGIRRVSDALKREEIVICKTCVDTIREFDLYRWDGEGKDSPRKENDHAMDDIRYFVSTILDKRQEEFYSILAKR